LVNPNDELGQHPSEVALRSGYFALYVHHSFDKKDDGNHFIQ